MSNLEFVYPHYEVFKWVENDNEIGERWDCERVGIFATYGEASQCYESIPIADKVGEVVIIEEEKYGSREVRKKDEWNGEFPMHELDTWFSDDEW